MGVAPPPVSKSEKAEALKVMERSGIPFEQAILVARGTVSLNDVLKEMLARDRRETLVREGMHPSLAGQVARGRLLREKALTIQKLWEIQEAPFSSRRLRQFVGGPMVAVSVFSRGMLGGIIISVGRYGFRMVPEGSDQAVELKKHDIKFYCPASDAADILSNVGTERKVASLNLGSSIDIKERFRPTEDLAVDWVKNRRKTLFVFRDGESLTGIPARVARFEIDLIVGEGATATLMTHALYKPQPYRHSDGND